MSENASDREKLSLKAFLSHRYRSPEVNLYFFDLLSIANVQFEVDEGITSTNVTRLERAVRDSNAFIGVYPFAGDPSIASDEAELLKASRYFRLELDLAIRYGKPTLVFYDHRFDQVLDFPAWIRSADFDLREVTGLGGSPRRQEYNTTISRFYEHVAASMATAAARGASRRDTVALILPPGRGSSLYAESQMDCVTEAVRAAGVKKLEVLPWPPVLAPGYFKKLDAVDWAIVDIGQETMETGIVGYLHGRAIPMLRLYKGVKKSQDFVHDKGYRTLFGGVEVGYSKDVVRWQNVAQLRRDLYERLATLSVLPRRISAAVEAKDYFESASRGKETVFVSYAGKDANRARPFAEALRKHFQKVFDYKDGESITPGEPWIEEIFDSISTAGLGIPLVSPSYVSSDNCMHEAQEMVARRDSKEMHMIPVKLSREDIELPTWMRNHQYLHLYDYPNEQQAAEKVVEFLKRAQEKKNKKD